VIIWQAIRVRVLIAAGASKAAAGDHLPVFLFRDELSPEFFCISRDHLGMVDVREWRA